MGKRLSVTLDDEDERLIEVFAARDTGEAAALREWAQARGVAVTRSTTEASLLRLLVRAGAEALRDKALDVSYARLGTELAADPDAAESRAARAGYVQRTNAR